MWVLVPMTIQIPIGNPVQKTLLIDQWVVEYAEVVEKDKYKIFTAQGECIVEVPITQTFTNGIEAKIALQICPITIGIKSAVGIELIFSNNPEVLQKVNNPKIIKPPFRRN